MKNGLNFEIPVNGMTEDVEQFRLLTEKNKERARWNIAEIVEKELNSDIQYCPNCGASVSEEQSGKNENSYQESNADGRFGNLLSEFFKAADWIYERSGAHIIDAIDKIIQMPPNIPKDSICPYCNSEDTFPIVKNETEIKTKGYSMGLRVLWNVFARSVWIIVRSAFHGL